MKKVLFLILIAAEILFSAELLFAQRIKDISYFKGLNTEQLIGYGLVTGLSGTGDSHRATFTVQSVINMMKKFGINTPNVNMRTRNVAAVMVTAKLNNLLKPGAEFDVTVSSLGDATSLMGGTLIYTILTKEGSIVATAQGPISVGGYDINTSSGGRIVKNHATTGRIPGGGIVRNEIPGVNLDPANLSVILRNPDFTTANNVANAINTLLGANTAKAIDATEIKITVPAAQQNNLPAFLAQIEGIQVQSDVIAKVVLNERTGTIVAGENVKILPVTISHGSLSINIKSFPIISQPNAFSQGETAFFNNLVPTAKENESKAVSISATNVQEVATALNDLKISPRDIIAVFQALKEAGALIAELIII